MDGKSYTTNCLECKKRSNCFQQLIPSELEFINQNKTQVTYQKGETICKEGAFASYVSYIIDGLVKVYIEDQSNKNINLKISTSSEFIGLSTIFQNSVYGFSAVALTDTSVCLIEKASFRGLLKSNGNFATEVIKWYCEKEKHLFCKIKSMGQKQMHGRMANTLLYLNSEEFNGKNLFSYISRKDIAEFACISTESVVRILKEMKNEGIIKLKDKDIEIVKPDVLERINKCG